MNFVLKLTDTKQVDAAVKAMNGYGDFFKNRYRSDWFMKHLFWAGFWGAYLENAPFENERQMAEALDVLHGPLQS